MTKPLPGEVMGIFIPTAPSCQDEIELSAAMPPQAEERDSNPPGAFVSCCGRNDPANSALSADQRRHLLPKNCQLIQFV
jgi:hypothetical protein